MALSSDTQKLEKLVVIVGGDDYFFVGSGGTSTSQGHVSIIFTLALPFFTT